MDNRYDEAEDVEENEEYKEDIKVYNEKNVKVYDEDNYFEEYNIEIKDKIKTCADKEEIDIIFKSVNIYDTSYIYLLAQNPHMITHIEEFMMIFINNMVGAIYSFLDAWADFWYVGRVNRSKYYADNDTFQYVRSVLINCLRTFDKRPDIDPFYIRYLEENFSINFYAETMAG